MKITSRTAVVLALGTAIISGFSNFIAKYAVTVINNPTVFTALKNAIVAILLLGIIIAVSRKGELKQLTKNDWIKLGLIGVIGGSIPFILFFKGLTLTSALSASFIHKTLFIWVAMLAIPFLKERLSWIQGLAMLLLLGGTVALSGSKPFTLGTGELMIFGATLFWAVENIIAKKALANISSITVAGARMIFGSIILLGVVAAQGNLSLMSGLTSNQWLWALIPAVLLLGYVLTWYTALKHAPATVVSSLLVPAALITNILTLIFQDKTLTTPQLISGGFFIVAIGLFLWQAFSRKKIREHTHASQNA